MISVPFLLTSCSLACLRILRFNIRSTYALNVKKKSGEEALVTENLLSCINTEKLLYIHSSKFTSAYTGLTTRNLQPKRLFLANLSGLACILLGTKHMYI